MSGLILPPEDRAHLLLMMRLQTPNPVHRRMNTLLLLDDGLTAEQVAKDLFIDAETVREHLRLYRSSSVTGVERLKCEDAEPALNEEQLAADTPEDDIPFKMATLELNRHLLAPEIHCQQANARAPPAQNLRKNPIFRIPRAE